MVSTTESHSVHRSTSDGLGADRALCGRLAQIVVVCLLTLVSVPALSQECEEEAWAWIGVDAFHCPGGSCGFDAAPEGSGLQFRFSAEPWMRAISPDGPAAQRLLEGDVLVAVNGLLITTASGGRELGHLVPGSAASITVRRGDRLHNVDIQPEKRCGGPLMLIGSSLLELPAARRSGRASSATRTAGTVDTLTTQSDPTLIDFTRPHRTRGSALDMSLGMTVRCADCTQNEDQRRWTVSAYPVVEQVVAGGVADEAGLKSGDLLLEIGGRDLRSSRGGELLFSPPTGDFNISYRRGSQDGTARINRRVIHQRIRTVINRSPDVRIQIRQGKDGWSPEVLGAIASWWSSVTRGDGQVDGSLSIPGIEQRWIANRDAWGLASLGLLFEAKDGRFFVTRELENGVQMRLLTEPVISAVIPGGPGEAAGLRVGDVIQRIDGHPVLGTNGSARFFSPRVSKSVSFHFLRDGKTLRTTLNPQENP